MTSFLLRSHYTRHPHHPTRTERPSGSPANAPLPPRPKSTLGFSSRFAQHWKASIATSIISSTPSSPVKAATPSPSRTSIGEEPNTPLPLGGRRQREPTLAPLSPLTAVHRPQTDTSARQPVAPRKPETPRTKAIHIEWRIAARQLEGDWKSCLMGAECLKVFDPLEGVKSEMVKVYSPMKASSHLVVKTIPVKPTTTYHPLPYRMSISPTPSSPTWQKPSACIQSASPTPLSRQPLATRRTVDHSPIPIALQAGITPRSARRMRHSLRMTPLTPLKPVCYVPLKSPAPSPRVSRDNRQIPFSSPKSEKTFATWGAAQEDVGAARSMESSYGDEEMECSIVLGGTITPPSLENTDPAALSSPWQVVRRTSPTSEEDCASEWVVTSPVRPQTDRMLASRRWRL